MKIYSRLKKQIQIMPFDIYVSFDEDLNSFDYQIYLADANFFKMYDEFIEHDQISGLMI